MEIICLFKNRNKDGSIKNYVLSDNYYNNQFIVSADYIRKRIKSRDYTFENLKLDSRGRIIDKPLKVKSTGYWGLDWYNNFTNNKSEIITKEDFLADKEKVRKKLKDDVLTEILVCRASHKHVLTSKYISKKTKEDIIKEKVLANKLKEIASWCNIDGVYLVFMLMNYVKSSLEMYDLDSVFIKNKPCVRIEEQGYVIDADDADHYVQVTENLWFIWLD